MRRFCWRERSEKLNWRLLGALDVADVVRRGDPALLEPYALHVTFARLPNALKDPTTRDAWFLVRLLQLSMEYLLFMRARDGDVLESLSQEMRHVETQRDELLLSCQKWKARTRSGEKQVEKLHQVLQNIAKLLQIHGASPSAVATIEALLTELISERRARQQRKVLVEKEGETEDILRPAVQEARVCGFCGKLFSSATYLEKHLVRRHGDESLNAQTPVSHKMKRDFEREDDDKENVKKDEAVAEAETIMQKMVQQMKRALHDHEEKLRSFAEEESTKVQQVYERLHTETKLAEELKSSRLHAEEKHEASRRELEELYQQKQKAEDELGDLKQQIQFLTMKKNMMGSAGLPANSPSKDSDELISAEAEIRNLRQILEVVNRELSSSREELAKVQALHLSTLKKKKELADKLASVAKMSDVVLQESSSQTEQPIMVNESFQTDEQSRAPRIGSETITEFCAPICEDVGTDALILDYEDVGIQTEDLLQTPASVDAEVQAVIEDDSVATSTPVASLRPSSDVNGDQIEESIPFPITEEKIEDHIPDFIQQIHIKDVLDNIADRAQRAASKVASNKAQRNPVSRNYSSISRHKYVRSRFHHDEDVVKERVSSCLSQLDQFSQRFGAPAKSAWLSDKNQGVVQQALHGHLEVLPAEVLARMIDCENAVNALIEKEWAPMEKTRQEALQRFKVEARAKSEASQGLVRRAMAAFGASVKAIGFSDSEDVTTNIDIVTEGISADSKEVESNTHELRTDRKQGLEEVSKVAPARRYSANNTLTVVVEAIARSEGTTYLADDFAESGTTEAQLVNSPEAGETRVHDDDEDSKVEDNSQEVTSHANYVGNEQASHGAPTSFKSSSDELQFVATSACASAELDDFETSLARDSPADSIRLIGVDAVTHDETVSVSYDDRLMRSRPGDFSGPEHMSIQIQHGLPRHEEVTDERSEWHLPRVTSSTDLESLQPRPSVHSAISTRYDQFEASSSHQPTSSLESDRLSATSEFELIQPIPRLDRTQSVVASSEMSFDTDIPSLGGEVESVEASTSAVVRGLVDLIDGVEEDAETREGSSSLTGRVLANVSSASNDIQNDTVMSFDDSDIEEVMLT